MDAQKPKPLTEEDVEWLKRVDGPWPEAQRKSIIATIDAERARADDAEGNFTVVLRERDEAEARADRLEAQCAEMREATKVGRRYAFDALQLQHDPMGYFADKIRADLKAIDDVLDALSSGQSLLDVVGAAEKYLNEGFGSGEHSNLKALSDALSRWKEKR